MNRTNVLKLAVALVLPQLAGLIGSLFTMPSIPTWYAALAKPALNPPSWVFGPVWTTLFILMGIASYLVWRRGLSRNDVRLALVIFLGQLVLNTLWSYIFFSMHDLKLAFIELVCLWLAIAATIFTFHKVSNAAAWLLAPYILWVSFAGFLNYQLWQLNAGHNLTPRDVPIGYSVDNFQVVETFATSTCVMDSDCSTPPRYLVRSNCPYTSKCLKHVCAVVCPSHI